MEKLTQKKLKELLYYNNTTGIFIWKTSPNNNVKIGDIAGSYSNIRGYFSIKINHNLYLSHRLVFLYCFGKFPISSVDHINHIKTDNRLINLREATKLENSKNQSLSKNNTSGINGISWHKTKKKWISSIGVKNKRVHLGTFLNMKDAVKARKKADIKYGFHKNHGKAIV